MDEPCNWCITYQEVIRYQAQQIDELREAIRELRKTLTATLATSEGE